MPFLLDVKGCVGSRNKMHERTMFDKCANTNLKLVDNTHDYQYITWESLSKFYVFKSKQFKGISLQNVNLGLQWVCNLELG